MGFLQDEMTQPRSRSWSRVGRVAGAGLGGAGIGVVVAWIWAAGAVAAGAVVRGCESVQGFDAVCVPVGPVAAAAAGSIAVICAGTLITFWSMRVRPRRLTVPAGCIVITVTIFCASLGFPWGREPAPWAAAIAAGAGLAAVALSAGRGRPTIAGLIVAGVVLLGSFIVPPAIARQEQTDSQEAKLTHLGFGLELPRVAGYYPMDGYAMPGGSLDVDMGRDGAPSTLVAFTVSITRTGTSDGAFDLGMCKHDENPKLTPQYSCQAKGPGLWLVTGTGLPSDEALAVSRGMIALAQPIGTQVPDEVLLQAVISLRPATAAQIAALH